MYSLLAAAARALSSLDSFPDPLLELGFGIPEDEAGIDDDDDDAGIVGATEVAVFDDFPDDDEDGVLGMPVKLPILEVFFDDDGVGLTVASLGSVCLGSVGLGSVCLGSDCLDSGWRGSVLSDLLPDFLPWFGEAFL